MRAANIPEKQKWGFIIILYLLGACIASLQGFHGELRPDAAGGRLYTNYNNYVIFKNSFFHLLNGKDLYIPFPAEQWDLYKYSPSFAFCFGLLAWMPDFMGLLCWNLLNTLPFLYGIFLLKGITGNNKILILLFCAFELMGSLQNAQSNGLMAALIILTFTSLEKGKYMLATFFVVFSVYLKIYGGIGFLLFLFYPFKPRLLAYTLAWFAIIGALPLLVIRWDQFSFLYSSWENLLATDVSQSTGVSVMGILNSWFHYSSSKSLIIASGFILLLLPFLQIRKYKNDMFRLLALAAILIWIVIFNHKAESPTYIISMSGIAIWFFSKEKTPVNTTIVVLAFLFTTLASGDLVPVDLKTWLKFYNIKALFSTILFFIIWMEMWHTQPRLLAEPV